MKHARCERKDWVPPKIKPFDINKYDKYTPPQLLTIHLATSNIYRAISRPTEEGCIAQAISSASAIRLILHKKPIRTYLKTKSSKYSTRKTKIDEGRVLSWR